MAVFSSVGITETTLITSVLEDNANEQKSFSWPPRQRNLSNYKLLWKL